MKVKELITLLQRMDPEAPVLVPSRGRKDYDEVHAIDARRVESEGGEWLKVYGKTGGVEAAVLQSK